MHERRKKINQIIQRKKNELSKFYLPLGDHGHETVVSLQNSIATLEAAIKDSAHRKPNDFDHSLALEKAARFAEKLDKWLKNSTARRNILLRILEHYCRPIDREIEIPAAHNNELKQDELKQITASSFIPETPVSGHITTEHQRETAASAAE
jgi:hypothetical protein